MIIKNSYTPNTRTGGSIYFSNSYAGKNINVYNARGSGTNVVVRGISGSIADGIIGNPDSALATFTGGLNHCASHILDS